MILVLVQGKESGSNEECNSDETRWSGLGSLGLIFIRHQAYYPVCSSSFAPEVCTSDGWQGRASVIAGLRRDWQMLNLSWYQRAAGLNSVAFWHAVEYSL